MNSIWRNIRFAARSLRRSPGFTCAAVISLALGIAANTATFSIVNALLLRPMPVESPARLVAVHPKMGSAGFTRWSYPEFEDLRRSETPFSGVYARSHWPVSVAPAEGRPEVVLGFLVSAEYFDVLGVRAVLGRTFVAGEEGAEAAPVAVISHPLWTRMLASDPKAIGKTIRINSVPFTLVGVTPPRFRGELAGFASDVWVPVTQANSVIPVPVDLKNWSAHMLDVGARLRDGTTPEGARAALDGLAATFRDRDAERYRSVSFTVLQGSVTRFPIVDLGTNLRLFLAVLSGVVGVVLLIACSNVANLLLARAVSRRGELALRTALGAGRAHLAGQMVTESLMLSFIGGVVAILLAAWAIEGFSSIHAPSPIPVELDVRQDGRVFLFTFGLSLAAGVLFGAVPALRAHRNGVGEILHEAPGRIFGSRRATALQSGLVIGQVALSLVLVIASGLCIKSLRKTLVADPGFDVAKGLVAPMNLGYGRYTEAEGEAYRSRLLERVRSLPGVESVSISLFAPLSFSKTSSDLKVDGYQPKPGERLVVDHNVVGSGYFDALGIPILDGRAIDDRDGKESEPVAVINQTMARRYFGDKSPVGKAFLIGDQRTRIIGVSGDGKYFMLGERPTPYLYLPLTKYPTNYFSLHVRARGAPGALIPQVAAEIEKLDPNLPAPNVATLEAHMALAQYPSKIIGITVASFGVVALGLALVGVYGVMSYFVSRRTHEIGVREALGAGPVQILALVMRRGLLVAGAGLLIGLLASVGLTRLLSGLLYGVDPLDMGVFAGVAVALACAVLLACYVPVRAAMRVDAAAALRHE